MNCSGPASVDHTRYAFSQVRISECARSTLELGNRQWSLSWDFSYPAGNKGIFVLCNPAPVAELSGGLTKTRCKPSITLLTMNNKHCWYKQFKAYCTHSFKSTLLIINMFVFCVYFFNWRIIALQCCVVLIFAVQQCESATVYIFICSLPLKPPSYLPSPIRLRSLHHMAASHH